MIVNLAPLIFPVKVAVPAVFVMDTVPVVVKLPTDWVAVPEIVNPPEPEVTVPLFTKSPDNVIRLLPGVNVVPEPIVNALIESALPNVVIPPVIFNVLNDVKVEEGRVFVAVSSTVPEPGVKVLLLLENPTANPLQIKLPPDVIVNWPKRFVPPEFCPTVTTPETVNCELALNCNTAVPLAFPI